MKSTRYDQILIELDATGGTGIGEKCRAGRRDIDDQLGLARRRCALGRAKALDDAVNLDAVLLRKELLGEPPVFGGDPQPPAVTLAEIAPPDRMTLRRVTRVRGQ